jgi:transcriptional regulator with XRE-family HTH domain
MRLTRATVTFDNSAASHTLTEEQFADAVGLSVAFIRQLRREGRIPHVRINRRVLYLRDDARRFLDQHRRAAVECGL